jgi:hypothetical protein
MAAFENILTDFKHHSEARVFKFEKSSNDIVGITYKTNTTEPEYRGLVLRDNRTVPIIVCRQYINEMPTILTPKELDDSILATLAEDNNLLQWYDQRVKNFWTSLCDNNISYLTNDIMFQGEGKFFCSCFLYSLNVFFCCPLRGRHIKYNFLPIFINMFLINFNRKITFIY